ncbi:hypothetical protein H2201_009113 [Coniosporium apollinis]|uniref:Uncharacterized protein n=1 Tax=Coniosporium apollinis TaxID=61459 RepID=A0ABQ9NHY5_9PEZI|nr:hypothetical protein H2201_009113 [Coniosporium apollinis]
MAAVRDLWSRYKREEPPQLRSPSWNTREPAGLDAWIERVNPHSRLAEAVIAQDDLFKKKPLNKSFFDDFKPTQGDRLKKPVLNSANYTNLKALSIIASSHVDSDGRVDRSKFRRPDVTEPRLTKKTFRESILGGRHVKMVVNYDTIMPKIFGPKFPEFTEIVAWWPAVRPSFFSNNRDTEALYKKTLEKYEDKINNAIVNAVFSEAWRLLQEGRSKAARVRSLLQNLDEQNELGKIESIEGPDTDINLDDLSSGDEEEDEEEGKEGEGEGSGAKATSTT